MKDFNNMNNWDKGDLLIKLFPDEVTNLLHAIKCQCDYFTEHETAIRDGWTERGFVTANFWYMLVSNTQKNLKSNTGKCKNRKKWFADNFFNGLDALFSAHCLILYAEETACNPNLRQAINLLFGKERIIQMELPEKP